MSQPSKNVAEKSCRNLLNEPHRRVSTGSYPPVNIACNDVPPQSGEHALVSDRRYLSDFSVSTRALSRLCALVVFVTALVVMPGTAVGGSGQRTPPQTWPNDPKFADHIKNIQLSGNWPGKSTFETEAFPKIRGGGHDSDPTNPNGLFAYLYRLMTAPDSKNGRPTFLAPNGASLAKELRAHFGIAPSFQLSDPSDLLAPGVITRNFHQYDNGVLVINLPPYLHTASYFKTLEALDYNDLRYQGAIPGARSLFPIGTVMTDILASQALLAVSPTTSSNASQYWGEVGGVVFQVQGHGGGTIISMFPTFNQPGGPSLPANVSNTQAINPNPQPQQGINPAPPYTSGIGSASSVGGMGHNQPKKK